MLRIVRHADVDVKYKFTAASFCCCPMNIGSGFVADGTLFAVALNVGFMGDLSTKIVLVGDT